MCDVLPPDNVFIPVLPNRIENKLMFTLCRTCAEINNQKEQCMHSDSEKMLSDTFVSIELYAAVSEGYEIKKINQVWHFEETTQYNRETKTGGLFATFQKWALKGKIEAMGWPQNCNTNDEKNAFLLKTFENEGIKLYEANMVYNNGLRMIWKLTDNDQWGYLAMNTVRTQHALIRKQGDLIKMITDKKNIYN